MRFVIALLVGLAPLVAHADGDTVALLPFDADKRLELYGQPVASEVAKALAGEHIEVVVVTAKDNMPARAKLIVDGTITAAGKDAVHLTARIRDRATGTTVAKVAADAAVLTSIDAAEASLAKDVLHAVQEQLAKKTAPVEPTKPTEPKPGPPPTPQTHSIIVAVGKGPLQELGPAATEWAMQHHRTVGAAGAADADATIALDPLSYDDVPGKVPMVQARVRVRISDRGKTVKFDRVVVTDTIVGDAKTDKAQLAARAAREVLLIVEPHMRRTIEAWK